jgi:hypothetical protein
MELEGLSCLARCSGDLGNGWAQEVLSLRSQISESLGEEWGGGCGEAPTQSGQDQWLPWYWAGSMCWGFSGSEGSTTVFVHLECDNFMVEELRGALELAAGRALAWYIVGDDGAGVGGLFRSSLPCGWGWWCVVSGVFVSVQGFVRMVVYASARYVPMLFLLTWHSSAPDLIKKKDKNALAPQCVRLIKNIFWQVNSISLYIKEV